MRRPAGFLRTLWQNRQTTRHRPRHVTFAVTGAPSSSALGPGSRAAPRTDGVHDELSIDEVDAVLSSLPRMATVRLTGGEPFARKDFWQIEELARRYLRPGSLHVDTDGVLTDRIVKFCDKRDKTHPVHLNVWIKPLDRASRWAESMQTVRILARYLEQFRLRLTVTQEIRPADDRSAYERLRTRFLAHGARYRIAPQQGRDQRAVAPSYAVPEGHVRVLPNGDLLACHCGAGRIGSLRRRSFDDLWHSDEARRMRDLAERCPACWTAAPSAKPELASAAMA